MSTGPRTKAGKALLEMLSNLAADLPLEFGDEPLERLDIEATQQIILAIEAETQPSPAQEPPRPYGTRLILAHENLLDEWGTRTEDGRRITVEWGEPDEHGWYTPTFRKHERSAGAAPSDVEALLIRIRDNLSNWYVCRLCDRAPNVRGHADDCPMPEIEAALARLAEGTDR